MRRSGICEAPREDVPLVADVLERVLGEVVDRLADPVLLLAGDVAQLGDAQHPPLGQDAVGADHGAAADRHRVAVGELLEQRGVHRVHERDACTRQDQRPRVRVAAAGRRRDVHDRLHARSRRGPRPPCGRGRRGRSRRCPPASAGGRGASCAGRVAPSRAPPSRARRTSSRSARALGTRVDVLDAGHLRSWTRSWVPPERPRRTRDSTRLGGAFRRVAGRPRRPRRRPACGTAPRRAARGRAARRRRGPRRRRRVRRRAAAARCFTTRK